MLETLVHAKEKLLIKNWADLLLSQYEQSSDVCEWFLETLSSEEWLLQVLVKCPIQSVRHVSDIELVTVLLLKLYYLSPGDHVVFWRNWGGTYTDSPHPTPSPPSCGTFVVTRGLRVLTSTSQFLDQLCFKEPIVWFLKKQKQQIKTKQTTCFDYYYFFIVERYILLTRLSYPSWIECKTCSR